MLFFQQPYPSMSKPICTSPLASNKRDKCFGSLSYLSFLEMKNEALIKRAIAKGEMFSTLVIAFASSELFLWKSGKEDVHSKPAIFPATLPNYV